MKIIFLCASLEPRRDGVGDYTVQLAGECARQGHGCTVIGLHDGFVQDKQESGAGEVRLIRFSSRLSWRERINRVTALVAQNAPQWISWQMVAYGYNPRGCLPRALTQLAGGLRGPRHQVMLHELWIGLERHAPWSQQVLGWWQQRRLLRWLRAVKPAVLQTSNPTYQSVLAEAGFAAEVLPLFGNVPIATARTGAPLTGNWLTRAPSQDLLIALTFGTLHPQWQPAATAAWLRKAAQALGRKPVLLAVGRLGQHADILQAFEREGVTVTATGEQDLTTISGLLAEADLGIALHPWALVGKSGAAAAMLDHGLPVLVPRDDWQRRNGAPSSAGPTDPLLCRLEALAPAAAAGWLAQRRAAQPALPRIAQRFLAALASAPAHE